MGVALNHLTEGSVGWFPTIDANWTTIESVYLGRVKSDTSVVDVSTLTETVLMNNTTISANTLGVGTVIPVWAAGNIQVPASSGPTITLRLRWGGIGGVQFAGQAFPLASMGSAYTVGWVADFRIIGVSTGVTGSAEVHGFIGVDNVDFSILQAGPFSIDTTTDKKLVWTGQTTDTNSVVEQRLMVTYRG